MVNKPKNKGTYTETAFVKYLQLVGWPHAERRVLQGALDKGDVIGTPGVCWECKVADAGFKLGPWLRETQTERQNSNSEWGVLVCKPKGLGASSVHRWPAVMRQGDFDRLRVEARAQSGWWGVWGVDTAVRVAKVAQIMPFLRVNPGAAAVYAPPGCLDHEEDWYVAVEVPTIVNLLRNAGFGNPIED